jgi:hypothetical protein
MGYENGKEVMCRETETGWLLFLGRSWFRPPTPPHVHAMQLPPVCKHHFDATKTDEENAALQCQGLCDRCHLSFSGGLCWDILKKYELTCQPRFHGDPPFAALLSLIRKRAPTQQELDSVLGPLVVKHVTQQQALEMAEPSSTALCSHRKDVAAYNEAVLQRLFPAESIVDLPLDTNAEGRPDYETWLKEPNFHKLKQVAVGARVALTANLDLAKVGSAAGVQSACACV